MSFRVRNTLLSYFVMAMPSESVVAYHAMGDSLRLVLWTH